MLGCPGYASGAGGGTTALVSESTRRFQARQHIRTKRNARKSVHAITIHGAGAVFGSDISPISPSVMRTTTTRRRFFHVIFEDTPTPAPASQALGARAAPYAVSVLTANGTKYPLCLLDTLAVSEMTKRPEGAHARFYEWALSATPCFVPCFSPFTLIELRRKPELFEQFIDLFAPFPCILLKGYEELLQDEVANYSNPSPVDAVSLVFTTEGGEGNLLTNLPSILEAPALKALEDGWNAVRGQIVEGMRALVDNYPPSGNKYRPAEVRTFIEIAGFSQLVYRAKEFVDAVVGRDEVVNIDAFPSLKASLYATFHKFYVDPTRRPSDSDAFDIIISSALPYVEAVITEAHLAETLRKTKRLDNLLGDLQIFTLRDFRLVRPNDP
jgi:hypothetical protein